MVVPVEYCVAQRKTEKSFSSYDSALCEEFQGQFLKLLLHKLNMGSNDK